MPQRTLCGRDLPDATPQACQEITDLDGCLICEAAHDKRVRQAALKQKGVARD